MKIQCPYGHRIPRRRVRFNFLNEKEGSFRLVVIDVICNPCGRTYVYTCNEGVKQAVFRHDSYE